MTGENVLEYKGYSGTVEYSAKDNILFGKVIGGKVIGVNGLISYEGDSVQNLKTDFEEAVDDYLAMCEAEGVEPEKTYKGTFNVRIEPELHRSLAIFAATHRITLNAAVENAVREFINHQ